MNLSLLFDDDSFFDDMHIDLSSIESMNDGHSLTGSVDWDEEIRLEYDAMHIVFANEDEESFDDDVSSSES